MAGRLVKSEVRPGIGIVGKIKIGEKRVNEKGKEYPAALDYFRADAPLQYAALFREAFGEKPNKIEIIFISDDLTHACNLQYELRGDKGGLFAKGDGETFQVFNVDHWSTWTKDMLVEKYGSIEAFLKASEKHCMSFAGWETRLTLRFMIPKIKGLLAEWQLSTKATKSSIGQITGAFDLVMNFAGTVINVPFDLTVQLAKSDAHGSKNKFPVIQLIPNASYDNLRLLRSFVDSGQEVWKNGVLTDERILQLKSGE